MTTGFKTTKGNVIFNKEGVTLMYLVAKNEIVKFGSYGNITTIEEAAAQLPSIEFDIEEIENQISEKQKEAARVATVRAQIILPAKQKLSIKEKNALKKEFADKDYYYVGTVTTTDSSRRKGGYFDYSEINHSGVHYMKGNEVFNSNHKCIVSARKKNFTLSKPCEFTTFMSALIANIEATRQFVFDNNMKAANAKLMVENVDIFKTEIYNILSK